ncbi:MAG: lamin tail domain-containing protein [Caldilinea sp.]|nr:lamin tail domain-containing protein [Caldilinea sp.]
MLSLYRLPALLLSSLFALWAAVASGADPSLLPAAPRADSPPIVINEILAHTDPPYVDSVELYNDSGMAVDLSGWLLTDKPNRPLVEWVRIPDGTWIGGNGYYVVSDQKPVKWSFGLSEGGDSIYLYRLEGGTPLLVDAAIFGASPRPKSFIRYVDSIERVHYTLQEGLPTLAAPNCAPSIGEVVLEELMVDPTATGGEYVVVANRTAAAVPLFDPAQPANSWKLLGQNGSGEENEMFVFPQNITLSPGERLILSEQTPAQFRQTYPIPPSVRVLGPLTSGMSKGGERVTLASPLEPELDGTVFYAAVDVVAYRNTAPWPDVAENGQALGRIWVYQFADDPANWRAVAPLQTLLQPTTHRAVDSSRNYLPLIYLPAYGCW